MLREKKKASTKLLQISLITLSYFLVECLAAWLLQGGHWMIFAFGLLWSGLLTAIVWSLPRLVGRIVYAVSYYGILLWTLAQTGYYQLFGELLWITDALFAGEGAGYLDTVLTGFSPVWWIGGVVLLALGVVVIRLMPRRSGKKRLLPCGIAAAILAAALFLAPELLFLRDNQVWGTHSEYGQSSSYRATYNTMYSARNVYRICGIYQLTCRDVWKHHLYPMTPNYRQELEEGVETLRDYFDRREEPDTEMTGIFAGKNVILVLMESMDDWMITPEDTPTLYKMMGESINFTQFYTPGYGGARTINSEFCINSGIYLPTNGQYVFNYVTNDYSQSIASQLTAQGYSAETFHYNNAEFYSRGVFEPALGYNSYVTYESYTQDTEDLYNDSYLFENPELADYFFRDGEQEQEEPFFNFLITRSAHLSYIYREVLSAYALRVYPEYRGKFGHEEIDCARVKAKLVDDMFAELLNQLEQRGLLEDTVIIGVTDHYTYGFNDVDTLMELSGTDYALALERTPCFIWSADGPAMEVDKTLNTADLLPTVLNLMGIETDGHYLGQDAFDRNYVGYAMFPDGSWISDGVFCQYDDAGQPVIQENWNETKPTEKYLKEMRQRNQEFVEISNLLLTTDYYRNR